MKTFYLNSAENFKIHDNFNQSDKDIPINQKLKKYKAVYKNEGYIWFLYFETEEDLTLFLLKFKE